MNEASEVFCSEEMWQPEMLTASLGFVQDRGRQWLDF